MPIEKVVCIVLAIFLVPLRTLGQTVPASHEILQFKHLSEEDGLPHGGVHCIIQDSRGFMWFGSHGLCKYDGYSIKVYRPKPRRTMLYDVRAIHEDREGMLWVGTLGDGIARFDPLTEQFTVYNWVPYDSNSLSHPQATTIFEDSEGVLWIGTAWEGLNRFDRATETFTRYKHSPSDPNGLSNRVVTSIYEDKAGRFWVGTEGGLNLLDRSTGRFTRYQHDPSDPHSLSSNMLNSTIWEDRDGYLWVGTARDVINRFDPDSGTFSRLPLDPNSSVPGSNIASAICEDRFGQIWIGTRDGLSRFEPETESFTRFLGVNYPAGEEEWQPYNDIRGILEDDAGDLWVGTGRGIYVLSDISDSGFQRRHYESLAGHWLGNFHGGACLKSSRGDLLFGSDNGLLAFHPQKMRDSDPPPVVLTELKLNGESVPIRADGSTTLVRHISASEEIALCRDVKALTLEFAALDFRYPEQNQYAYLVEGIVDDWVHQGSERSVTLTNLNPGNYVFRVKAAGSDGVWNEAGTSLRLIVTPLWWETTWFKLLVVAVVIGAAVGGYEGRVQLAKTRQRSLEEKVSERTSTLRAARDTLSEARDNLELQVQQRTAELRQEIADCEKAQEATRAAHETLYHLGRVRMLEALSSSLSHEMQQPLTGVLSNAQAVEMLLENPQADIDGVRDTVKDIVADAKRAGEVIWQLRAFLRKQDPEMKLLNPNDLIEGVLSVLHSDMIIHNTSMVKDLAADLPQVMGDDVQLKQVLINLIVNAQEAMESSGISVQKLIIHTSMDGTGKITVGVEDSGPGLEEAELTHIFEPFYTTRKEGTGMGLAISRFIIEAHGGQIWAENCAGGGARVCFSLPVTEGSPES